PSATPVPFAFTFGPGGRLVDGEAGASSVTTYLIGQDGTLADPKSQSDGQVALCWIERVGRFYIVSNTGSNTLSAFGVGGDGQPLLVNAVAANTNPGAIDLASSGAFLYAETGLQSTGDEFGLDVVGRDDDTAVDRSRAALHRRRERDGGRGALWGDLDPPHLPVGEGLVDPLLEAERVDVERERAILVGGRDGHAADLGDVELAGHGGLLSRCSCLHELRPAVPAKLIGSVANVGFRVIRPDELEWAEREPEAGGVSRHVA